MGSFMTEVDKQVDQCITKGTGYLLVNKLTSKYKVLGLGLTSTKRMPDQYDEIAKANSNKANKVQASFSSPLAQTSPKSTRLASCTRRWLALT